MARKKCLVASELGFYQATGISSTPIGERNPILVEMENMGITWTSLEPDRFGDSLWFYGAKNVPDALPDWLYWANKIKREM